MKRLFAWFEQSRERRLLSVALLIAALLLYELLFRAPLAHERARLEQALLRKENNYQQMIDQIADIRLLQQQGLSESGGLPEKNLIIERFALSPERIRETDKGIALQADAQTIVKILNALPPNIAFSAKREDAQNAYWSLELWVL